MSLFDFDTVETQAKRNDPSTSAEAAQNSRSSGSQKRKMAAILNLLRESGPSTYSELCEQLDEIDRDWIKLNDFSRRLPDLEAVGKVKRAGKRLCRVAKTNCTVWVAIEPSLEE